MCRRLALVALWSVLLFVPASAQRGDGRAAAPVNEAAACQALLDLPNLTITSATLKPVSDAAPEHCYVRGTIGGGRIRFHMQLPVRAAWNGRLLNMGDGGKDGALNYSNPEVAAGYAVANSNGGHDSGAEPGSTFGTSFDAVVDFGYRAVHLTAIASKTLVNAYYGKPAHHAYFQGCSTGGRQGLMEAQRFPDDFDGIVSGAPVFDYEAVNVAHVFMAQRVLADHAAGNLAFDLDGDGVPESLTKMRLLEKAVLQACDARDGITDGLVDDPLTCDFKPQVNLADKMCPGDVNGDACFTKAQIRAITELYRGPYDSKGRSIRKGLAPGSEFSWEGSRIAHKGNRMLPVDMSYATDHLNYLFYQQSPGMPPPVVNDLSLKLDKRAVLPEFGWWEFNMDDLTSGKGAFMAKILEATDPDLTRFLKRRNGKLLLYHGWGDTTVSPEPTLDYYKQVVQTTFGGDVGAARERTRIFMIPGVGHCEGGPGCDQFNKLTPLVEWVEQGKAPDYLVAQHVTNKSVDNERRICGYPQKTVYVGPAGGQNDRANWVEKNFACR
jgi:feruloyl esterase